MMTKLISISVGILIWMNCLYMISGEKPGGKFVPVIMEAKLPLYPANARASNISGLVKLKITTDGEKVSNVNAIEGPPMLSIAATEMVFEWKFLKHDHTDFIITIQYILTTTGNRVNDIVSFDVANKIVIHGVRTKG
jgi:hypothetical protein